MKLLFVTAGLMFPLMSYAQDLQISTDEFLMYLLQSLGGFKGASSLVVAGLIVQIFIKFLNSDLSGKIFAGFKGFWKLAIVSFLSVVSGVISLMLNGVSLGAALLHSSTLAAIMVLLNQFVQQYQKK